VSDSTLPAIPRGARVADVLLSVALAPFWGAFALLMAAAGARPRMHRALRLRRDGGLFVERRFDLPAGRLGRLGRVLGVHRLPTLLNVLRGELSWVGPRALAPFEANPRDGRMLKRDAALPGLLGLWGTRRRGNVAHGTEIDADLEYVEGKSASSDAGLLVRAAALHVLVPEEEGPTAARLRILGHRVDNLTMAATLSRLAAWLEESVPRRVAFLNADCVNQAAARAAYRAALGDADMVLADGIGMRMAGLLLGQRVCENVNGTDLFPRLCAAVAGTGHSLFLLGGRPGVAEGVAAWVAANHPHARVAGLHHGFFSAQDEPRVIAAIRESGASVLLVALGAPRQDEWIHGHLAGTGARLAIGVGGLFDFYSGRVSRAPGWMRELGLEWVYRFLQEPGRMWKRYWVGNAVFLARVLRERWRSPAKARRSKEQIA
jgi:N-acetylglucosaminyldiphosphoundecaprenol N-acetyl-beta-D-mannosaminyltransferase